MMIKKLHQLFAYVKMRVAYYKEKKVEHEWLMMGDWCCQPQRFAYVWEMKVVYLLERLMWEMKVEHLRFAYLWEMVLIVSESCVMLVDSFDFVFFYVSASLL